MRDAKTILEGVQKGLDLVKQLSPILGSSIPGAGLIGNLAGAVAEIGANAIDNFQNGALDMQEDDAAVLRQTIDELQAINAKVNEEISKT